MDLPTYRYPVTTKALVLGGGAPNATLMAGAVCAFHRHGVRFDLISSAGAGALIGLLAVAPKNQTPEEALRRTVNYGVDDLIYSFVPVNYKVFQKRLPVGEPLRALAKCALGANPLYAPNPTNEWQRLTSDWLTLLAAGSLPWEITYADKGLCANVPFVEDVIDFEALRALPPPEFFLNAYNIDDRRMETFSAREITAEHFRAALAFPYIYPPVQLNGKYYYEGAAHDSLNYIGLLYERCPKKSETAEQWVEKLRPPFKTPGTKVLVVLDVIGADQLIRVPRNLWDALNISIITPLVEIAKDDTKLFEKVYLPQLNEVLRRREPPTEIVLQKVDFSGLMPPARWPESLDWSYSNVKSLFAIGEEAAQPHLKSLT